MSNTLVSPSVDTASPFSGAYLLQDGADIANAIKNGDWVSGGIAAFSGVLDTAAAVIDPIGTLVANGLGWLIDHFDPLKTWFDQLTGDADEVAAFSRTWNDVANRMREVGATVRSRIGDLQGLGGETIDAYRSYAGDLGTHLAAMGDWADSVASGLQLASQLVRMVHDLVRDALSQVVGMAVSAAVELLASVGTAAPAVLGQITTRVSALATRIGRVITRLVESIKSLRPLLESFERLGGRVAEFLRKLLPGTAAGREITMRPLTAAEKVTYRRPSNFRKGVRESTWESARSPSGQVHDPHSGARMDPSQPWDMGHRPGYEFRKHQVSAADRGISRGQFLDEHNDPGHYRPELPSSNRSHQAEDHTDTWLGH